MSQTDEVHVKQEHSSGTPFKLSIVIPNHNYEEFIGEAIKSALSVRWPLVEVIVVDDGSTDNSRQAIDGFADQVTAIFQPNGKQRVACNTGFARSTGDIVIFLDSDDMLEPSVAVEIAKVWRPGVSKVQYQMARVDVAGRPTGSVSPVFRPLPSPELIRHWVQTVAAYPSPPGSGNAYSRAFLDRIFPQSDACGDFSDTACITAAPLFGDVVTIAKPLARYRIHSRNDSGTSANDSTFSREVDRAIRSFRYQQGLAQGTEFALPETALFNSLHLLKHRAASLRLTPRTHPLAGDNRRRALGDTFRAWVGFSAMSFRRRSIVSVWLVLTLVAPLPLARRLISLMFRR